MINTTQAPSAGHTQTSVVVRALSSITSEQADAIAGMVHASGLVCDIQFIDDYDGYLSVLIEPSVVTGEPRAFFISGTAQHLELAEIQDDGLVSIGTFADTDVFVAHLTRLLRI